jgi:hypothetical protein
MSDLTKNVVDTTGERAPYGIANVRAAIAGMHCPDLITGPLPEPCDIDRIEVGDIIRVLLVVSDRTTGRRWWYKAPAMVTDFEHPATGVRLLIATTAVCIDELGIGPDHRFMLRDDQVLEIVPTPGRADS